MRYIELEGLGEMRGDGERILGISLDRKSVKVYDICGELVDELVGFRDVMIASWSGEDIVVMERERDVVKCLSDGGRLTLFIPHNASKMAIHPLSGTIVCGNISNYRIISSDMKYREGSNQDTNIGSCCWHPMRNEFVIRSYFGIRTYLIGRIDKETGFSIANRIGRMFNCYNSSIFRAVYSPCGEWVAMTDRKKRLYLVSDINRHIRRNALKLKQIPCDIVWLNDNRLLVLSHDMVSMAVQLIDPFKNRIIETYEFSAINFHPSCDKIQVDKHNYICFISSGMDSIIFDLG